MLQGDSRYFSNGLCLCVRLGLFLCQLIPLEIVKFLLTVILILSNCRHYEDFEKRIPRAEMQKLEVSDTFAESHGRNENRIR